VGCGELLLDARVLEVLLQGVAMYSPPRSLLIFFTRSPIVSRGGLLRHVPPPLPGTNGLDDCTFVVIVNNRATVQLTM